MESFKIKLSNELHISTPPLEEKPKLFSPDVNDFCHSEMTDIEKRIIEWLENNEILMMIDPEEKQHKFFSEQRQRSLSYFKKSADRLKSFSLDESPLYLRHKKSSSPSQKLSSIFSPEKINSNDFNLMTLSNNELISDFKSELTKSTMDKLSMSESIEELIKKDDTMIIRYQEDEMTLKISEIGF